MGKVQTEDDFEQIKHCDNATELDLCHNDTNEYLARFPPLGYGNATEVNVTFALKQVMKISENAHIIKVFCTVTFDWKDPRLSLVRPKNLPEKVYQRINAKFLSSIWRPSIFVVEATKLGRLGSFAGTPSKSLWYSNENELAISESIFISFSCRMNYESFPYDNHTCPMTFRMEQDEDKVKFNKILLEDDDGEDKEIIKWSSRKLNFDVEIKGLEVATYSSYDNFSMVPLKFTLTRNKVRVSKIQTGFYVTSILVTIISSFSFFINPEMVYHNL